MRLLPCPSCGRHVRVADGDCPFCGAGLTTSAPGWLSIALLGLALVGCDPGKPEPTKSDGKAKTDVQPQPEPPAPTTAAPPPEPPAPTTAAPPPEPLPTTAAPEPPAPTTAVDAGAMTVDPPPEVGNDQADEADDPPPPKPKYGAPRPAKKYGAPPKPPTDPPLD